jgi:hypothetical protein
MDAPQIGSPCDCTPSHILDVAGLVAAHVTMNDDAAAPIDPTSLDMPSGQAVLDLPCGQYYLTAINVSTAATLNVHGRVAIFVGGDVTAGSDLRVNLDSGAELDLFVAGNLTMEGTLSFGSQLRPSATRAYVGGTSIQLASAEPAGFFYAPHADVSAISLTLYGGLFANSFVSTQSTGIHFDTSVGAAGTACGATVETGVIGSTCTTNSDCAATQACRSNVCTSCIADADCAGGRLCVNGTCE